MPVSIEVHDMQDYVLATYVGPFTVKGTKEAIDRVLEAIAGSAPRAILIDCRLMTGRLSVVDRFQTVVYGQKMIGKVSKLAIVRPPDLPNPDRFVETVAANRGIRVRLFAEMDEAATWLVG